MSYVITESPHYKGSSHRVLYVASSKKEMLKQARLLSFKEYLVDCWSAPSFSANSLLNLPYIPKTWDSIGAVIAVNRTTAYLYYMDRKTWKDVFQNVNPDGTLDLNVTEKGVAQADRILRHWL